MNIEVPCPKCTQHDLFNVEIDEQFFSGKNIKCENGHELYFISQSPRYQFLLQQSIESCKLGFYFESFHTLYSGFEAYKKEFVASHVYNEFKNIESSLKLLKKIDRSERLEGAFTSTYISLSNGVMPPQLSRDNVEFRNNIVHKGHVPNEKNCKKIGNAIFKIIAECNNLLYDRLDKETDFHPIMQKFEMDSTNFLLEKQGYNTKINTPEDFYNRDFLSFEVTLNILSPSIVLDSNSDIDNLFSDSIENSGFILNPLGNYYPSTNNL